MNASSSAQPRDVPVSSDSLNGFEVPLHKAKETTDECLDQNSSATYEAVPQLEPLNQGSSASSEAGDHLTSGQEEVSSTSICETSHHPKVSSDDPDVLPSTNVDDLLPLKESPKDDTEDHPKRENKQHTKQGLLGLDLDDPTEVDRLFEKLQETGLLMKYGYQKNSSPEPETKKQVEAPSASKPELPHGCTTCKKRFARRCELKYVIRSLSVEHGLINPPGNMKNGMRSHMAVRFLYVTRNSEVRTTGNVTRIVNTSCSRFGSAT